MSVDTGTWRSAGSSSCGQNLVKPAVGRIQWAPDCTLPEKDVGRMRQILVDECSRGSVPRSGNRSQLLEVAAEMSNELRWVSGVGDAARGSLEISSGSPP